MRAFLLLLAMLPGLISDGPLTTNSTTTALVGAYATVGPGTITDAVSGAPLWGAQIHVEGLTLSALAANVAAGVPSSDFTFAASVAAFGMVLRDSKYCSAVDLAALLRWARSSVGPDLEGYRREFVRMVEETRHLADRG
jgi:hypothetical protein